MKPVFIGGAGRSGTTLLGAMLGMHSECLTVPESQFKIDMLRFPQAQPGVMDPLPVLNMIREHRRFKLWSLDLGEALVPGETIGSSYQELLEWIVGKYGGQSGKAGYSLWVDHTPDNIRYATTLLNLFPEAIMIHIVRDGRAVASSIMPLDWGPNTIVGAAHAWVESMAHGLAAEVAWKTKCLRISYEDLVMKPEDTLRTICRHLCIEYQPCMIEARGYNVPYYSAEQHELIGQKPDPTRALGWEKELTPREIEIFESLTGDFLAYFGYDMKYGTKARPPTGRELVSCQVRELFQRWCVNRFLFHRRMRRALKGKIIRAHT